MKNGHCNSLGGLILEAWFLVRNFDGGHVGFSTFEVIVRNTDSYNHIGATSIHDIVKYLLNVSTQRFRVANISFKKTGI